MTTRVAWQALHGIMFSNLLSPVRSKSDSTTEWQLTHWICTGDAAVGKSSLLTQLTDQRFLANPDPTVRFISFLESLACLMLKRESPVLCRFSSPPRPAPLLSWMRDFNQLGVEFGSKLITLPDDNKVVKLQCELKLWMFVVLLLCLTIVLIRLGHCRSRVVSLYNAVILSRSCRLSTGLRCDVSEKSVYF